MGMFTNYENIPASYIPCNEKESIACKERYINPMEEYNAKGELIGYSWMYGDNIVLEFCTSGEVIFDGYYEDASTYLKDKKLLLEIFDFRYENIYSDEIDAETEAKFYINYEQSKQLVKGVYTCRLTLIDNMNNSRYTLISNDDCVFMVN